MCVCVGVGVGVVVWVCGWIGGCVGVLYHLLWIYVEATTLEGVALNERLQLKTSSHHCDQKCKLGEKSNMFCYNLHTMLF